MGNGKDRLTLAFIELDATFWSNNTVRVMARNISAATFDLAAATLSVGVVKRRIALARLHRGAARPPLAARH